LADPLAALDDCGWLGGRVQGQRVLCLAAGGGKHGVLFALAGATVTVVDLSPRMLELDRQMAAEHRVRIEIVDTPMEDLSAFGDASFDLVVQPVSTCYVPDLRAVYREVARVTAAGGLYISQHKQPASLQAGIRPFGKLRAGSLRLAQGGPSSTGYLLTEPYARQGPLPPVLPGCLHREAGTLEFLHRWTDLLGGLCRAGFVIEDLVEPPHGDLSAEAGSFKHRSAFLPPYVTVKARREASRTDTTASKLWIP
jgi:SAM-dependent methyltransferase